MSASAPARGARLLVLLRHGESEWNALGLFTGWADPGLSAKGESEALEAAALLSRAGLASTLDAAFTSVLRRSAATAWLALRALELEWLPLHADWRLNERCYGALQGLSKAETAAAHGEAQVARWRRSYGERPPALAAADPRHPAHDRRYAAHGVPAASLPAAESLADTVARVLPCWRERIAPALAAPGRRVLVAAHGNSLRALLMHLEGLSEEEIMRRELPTGVPYVLELNDELKPVNCYFLGDAAAVAEKQAATAAQGKAKLAAKPAEA
jgi:2,3-bisphosphoglycerate-dependent phosphoglycerate mutase